MLRKFFGFFAAFYSFSAAIGAVIFLMLFFFADGGLLDDSAFIGEQNTFGLTTKALFIVGFVTNFMFFIGCAFLARVLLKSKTPAPKDRSHEQIILDLAVASQGTLSIAEIAAQTSLTVAEAKEGIEALTLAGVASVEFNEQEDVFYRFPGLGEISQSKESK